jgi:tRNA A37 methylthiotransferase MiaB
MQFNIAERPNIFGYPDITQGILDRSHAHTTVEVGSPAGQNGIVPHAGDSPFKSKTEIHVTVRIKDCIHLCGRCYVPRQRGNRESKPTPVVRELTRIN